MIRTDRTCFRISDRVVGLIFNPHADIAAVHSLQGVAILLGGLGLLYLWDGVLERSLPREREEDRPEAPMPMPSLGRPLLATGLLAAGAGLSLGVPRWVPDPVAPPSLNREVPLALRGWRSTQLKPDHLFLSGVTLTSTVYRRYEQNGKVVNLFVGVGNQSHGARGVFSPKTGFPGSGWILDVSGSATLEPDGVSVAAYQVRSATETRLVYHWYMGTDGFGAEVLRSLLALESSWLERRAPAVVVRMSTPLDGPPASARSRAEARLQRFFQAIRSHLGSLGGQVGQWKRFSCFSLPGKTLSSRPAFSVNSLSIKSVT